MTLFPEVDSFFHKKAWLFDPAVFSARGNTAGILWGQVWV